MDMKRILQALDGVATKPVAGADSMAKFLSIVTEADLSPPAKVNVPPIPKLPAQDGDQGNGEEVKTNQDGTRLYFGAFGIFLYDKAGKAIKYTTPEISPGIVQTVDLTTGKTVTSYNMGPMHRTQNDDGSAEQTIDFGTTKAIMKRDADGTVSQQMVPAEMPADDEDGVAAESLVYDMKKFLSVVKETDSDQTLLSPDQQQRIAPYLKKDPDGSQYYDLPATDHKEIGAVTHTAVTSPATLAQIKSPEGQKGIIQHLLAITDPANAVNPVTAASTPVSDTDAAAMFSADKNIFENALSKFLSIVKKNDVGILNEGTNPHKVSLPVQMAMQHYQQKEEKTKARVGKTTSVGKYFHEVEQEFQEQRIQKRRLIDQYASTIAERVLMKESRVALSEKSTTEKQARTMAAAAHDPKFAKKVGIEKNVAKEFNQKDKGTKLLSNAMKKKKNVKENEIPDHSMGFKPGPGGPGLQSNVAEAPLDFDKDNPTASTIHSHQGVNPASIEARIVRARGQLKDLARRADSNELIVWESIAQNFSELAMNMEQIRHGIEELANIRKGGGHRVRNIPKDIGEETNIKEANAKKRTLKNSNPCWSGYEPVGTKKKGGRTVPNCVPKD